MDLTGKYTIHLIASLLNGKVPVNKPDEITFENLYCFSTFHNVSYMCFEALKKTNQIIPEDVSRKWENKNYASLTQSVIQLHERDVIYQLLEEQHIRYLPLKGCLIKEMYPHIAYREMSDLDILIDEKNAVTVRKAMETLGYECPEFGRLVDDSYFKGHYMHVEMHYRLMSEYHFEKLDWPYPKDSFLLEPWNKAVKSSGHEYRYQFTDEDFYVYMIVHLAKHFYTSGCGIRQFLDLYYLSQNTHADRERIYRELDKYGLKEFCVKAERIADCWMHMKEMDPDLIEMEEEIFSSGVFGTKRKGMQQQLDRINEKSGAFIRLRYFWNRLFPSVRFMEIYYPVLHKHQWLLPFFWIVRIVTRGIFKIPQGIQEMKYASDTLEKAKQSE